MKLQIVPAVLVLATLTSLTPVFAIAATHAEKTQASTAHSDTEFLKKAYQGSYNEIDLGHLVVDKTTDEDVKAFAQKMIDDHTKIMDSFKPFAMEAGVDAPTHGDVGTLATEAKLKLLSGKSFDKSYIKGMVEDHHKDLEAFMHQIKETGYPAFKDVLEKDESMIKEHLELINGIAKKHGERPARVPAGS